MARAIPRPPGIHGVLLLTAAATAFGSLLIGTEAGLDRLGVGLLGAGPAPTVPHGGLMVGGFVGTLIAVERARASGRTAPYLVPLLSAAGGLHAVSLALYVLGMVVGVLLHSRAARAERLGTVEVIRSEQKEKST